MSGEGAQAADGWDAVGGYAVGPVLTDGEPPWPICWEQDPRVDDGHEHRWESVLLAAGPGRRFMDEVVRCQVCHAPRCGHRDMTNPCMDRRHHRSDHQHLDGQTAPLGERLGRSAP